MMDVFTVTLKSKIMDRVTIWGIDGHNGYFVYGKKYLATFIDDTIVKIFDENRRWAVISIEDTTSSILSSFSSVFDTMGKPFIVENETELQRKVDKLAEDEMYRLRCKSFMEEYNQLVAKYDFRENHNYTIKSLIPTSLKQLFRLE